MANNHGIAGDPKRRLGGIRAFIDPERGLVFVHNEKRDEWLMCCPHCGATYWYKLGEYLSGVPDECERALIPDAFCGSCRERLRYDTPEPHVCKPVAVDG